jgi:hypothetical protein
VITLIEGHANRFKISAREAAKRFMDELDVACENGTPDFLGPTWKRDSKNGKTEKEPELTFEQLALLERSSTLASGFAGVHANGAGWRANVRGRSLPTRKTPEHAAWDRYQFIQQSKVNPIEETMAWLRQEHPNWTEEELRREAEEMESLRGGSLPGGALPAGV